MKITDDRARDLLRWLDDMAGDHTLLFEEMALHRDAAALIRQLQDAEQAAWHAGLDAGREQGRGKYHAQQPPSGGEVVAHYCEHRHKCKWHADGPWPSFGTGEGRAQAWKDRHAERCGGRILPLYGTPPSVPVGVEVMQRRLNRKDAEIAELQAKLKQAHKDYGCELADPNGTIWDHASNLKREVEALRAEVAAQRTRADAMAGEAIKHEARAERLAEALREAQPFIGWTGSYPELHAKIDALLRDQEEGK